MGSGFVTQDPTDSEVFLVDGVVFGKVHAPDRCEGRPCIMHSPTDHHMRSWPLYWRDMRGTFERICEHDIGHPDPDQFDYWERAGLDGLGIHDCDGCCHRESK